MMKFIYIQTIKINSKTKIPFRIFIGHGMDLDDITEFSFRSEAVIPKAKFLEHELDRRELLNYPLFFDIADELLDIFINKQLVFSHAEQFNLLKSQFIVIGYNFDIKPIILCNNLDVASIETIYSTSLPHNIDSRAYGIKYINCMQNYYSQKLIKSKEDKASHNNLLIPNLSKFKMQPGIYYFLNERNEVIYVGKAKNIRKRLQNHFSNGKRFNNIDYSQIHDIVVEYSGTDLIAQLMESARIKKLKPIYNTQQLLDASPFIIVRGETAKGIYSVKITRKDFKDNVSEKYFNRISVKESLNNFCLSYNLCRKLCSLETVLGPCSKVTKHNLPCVCAGTESIDGYNRRFNLAFDEWKNRKSRKIFKLKGRNGNEDAFIYTINGIYQGYGFIDKCETINNENDILGFLNPQSNNYDTTRIINGLHKKYAEECIILLDSEIN
ncbi:GIY-YIG nuclease family protein [Mariniflexile gromovii]|uniref:Excinuclease cho n=1 Tax=Mariniflexile gromovii TaxID=362523 RepID=A0ABS4BRI3_9FLAO|nr:GIY-YIG nuclease family protein [Mariniflexile gromovii]MBP0903174.1 GIY-YIG nuclease family protein [Mariniflexile gromovii]